MNSSNHLAAAGVDQPPMALHKTAASASLTAGEHRKNPVRVLYSFPHKMGAGRICYIAWEQVRGLAAAGAEVTVFPGVLQRALPASVRVIPTLSWGKLRLPYKVFGTPRTCAIHDHFVARRLCRMAGQFDIVHTWPLGARATLKMASRLGMASVLERPNTHTRFAYDVVKKECDRIGVPLPADHEHSFNARLLAYEEEEYQLANALLCPSDFVADSFVNEGFKREKLLRHIYGFDERRFSRDDRRDDRTGGLTMIYVGGCAVRKGLHFALEAWLNSPASRDGTFLIAGDFIPAYQEKLAPMLAHPSVKVLGHRKDVPELMRQSDIFVLPSLEEGSALVVSEAMGSGCVPLISNMSSGVCRHDEHGLIHQVSDVKTLTEHISLLYRDRALLARLRAGALAAVPEITWTAAGVRLLAAYREVLAAKNA